MELSPKQQTTDLIRKSNKLLIVGRTQPDGDTMGSILALTQVMKDLGKEVTVVISADVADKYKFLPSIEKTQREIEGTNDFVIKLDVKDSPVEKLSYNVKDGILNIIVTPKNGSYEEKNINFSKGSYDFDLVIVLDTADVDSIDKVYDTSTDLFFEKPVINIDHHSGNEYFGTVNLVDITATSTCEVLVSIIESLGQNLLTEDVATNLLAGIIYDTGSFKKKNTTPKSLTVAAQLLAAGARQQEIIDNFYKTKPLSTLKLWGKILSGLTFEENSRFVWTKISKQDFDESGLDLTEVQDVMNELISNTPGADVVLLIVESEKGKVFGKLKGLRGSDVLKLAELFGGTGQFHSATFEVNNLDFNEVEEKIIKKITENIKSRLGIREEDHGKRIFVPLQKLDKEKLPLLEKEAEPIKLKEILNEDPDLEKKAVEEVQNLVEKELNNFDTPFAQKDRDPISKAIESIDKNLDKKPQGGSTFTALGDILKEKHEERKIDNSVFYDEDQDYFDSDSELLNKDEDEGDQEIRVWRE